MLVQTVLRPNPDTRLYAGIIAGGSLRRGDPIRLAHSALSCHVNRISLPEKSANRPQRARLSHWALIATSM